VYNSFIIKFNENIKMFKAIVNYFDKLEDKVRTRLSHRSIVYAFIGGMGTILLWRGIWHTADILMFKGGFWGWFFYEPITLIWASILLLMTGLFVSNLIGERVIISGLKKEKKVTDRTEAEIGKEEDEIRGMKEKILEISKNISEIKKMVCSPVSINVVSNKEIKPVEDLKNDVK